MGITDTNELENIAQSIRKQIILMTSNAGSGHYSSSLSTVDILVSLYYNILNHDPQNPQDALRDRFVLSKGHAAPALYVTLCELGYFPKDELKTFRQINSRLEGHPKSHLLPGVDASSGSLSQGFSTAAGMALASKLDNAAYNVFVLLGDGECQEGQIWETAMFSSHYKLNNLIAIIDCNGLQSDGSVEEVMSLSNLGEKWSSFGWDVINVDGHDISALTDVFKSSLVPKGRPTVVLANTVKGKGIPFIENKLKYHSLPLNEQELISALECFGDL
ncbi:transketolase [Methanolobus sp. WCC1]|uniref:transketolase n=1 Tax=unclassified Methanolobus TaxID=2629569 RepID=UPI00324727B5